MRHEISQSETTRIQQARVKQAAEARKTAEKAEYDRWCSEMERKYNTQ
jgi:hypothetical protein